MREKKNERVRIIGIPVNGGLSISLACVGDYIFRLKGWTPVHLAVME